MKQVKPASKEPGPNRGKRLVGFGGRNPLVFHLAPHPIGVWASELARAILRQQPGSQHATPPQQKTFARDAGGDPLALQICDQPPTCRR